LLLDIRQTGLIDRQSLRYFSVGLLLSLVLVITGCSGLSSGRPVASAIDPLPVKSGATKTPAEPAAVNTPTAQIETPAPTATEVPYTPLRLNSAGSVEGSAFKSIEAVDRMTVRFTLCQPDPAFISKLAFPTMSIYPLEWLEKAGSDPAGEWLKKPIGSGPYRVTEWQPGQRLVLQGWNGYWGVEKAHVPQLIFRWEPDPGQRLLELQMGTAQGIDEVNALDVKKVQDNPDLALLFRPALSVAYLGINNQVPPFDNEAVRQAVAQGIDRLQILNEDFPPGSESADYFTPCVVPDGCSGERWYDMNLSAAKKLLADAGYAGGFETDLAYRGVVRGYLAQPDVVAQSLRTQLARNLGIRVHLRAMDPDEFIAAADAGSLPALYLLGWSADYPDVGNFLETHFGAQAEKQFGLPFGDLQKALQLSAGLSDPEALRPVYEAANNAIRQHVPMVPLAHSGWVSPDDRAIAYSRKVAGVKASPLGVENFAALSAEGRESLTWLQPYEPQSLYCAMADSLQAFQACSQVAEGLYRYQPGSVQVEPALAEGCHPVADTANWECTLKQGILFQDGSTFDANDVVMSFGVQWDAAQPLHKVNPQAFAYFKVLWESLQNPAP
jgi:peptide/nickel transport system substrate-binding protein